MRLQDVAKKLQQINGNGKRAQSLYDQYYEKTNITMTVANVLTELIEKITKKEFDISVGMRILNLSTDEKIYMIINSNIDTITLKNSKLKTTAVLKTDKFDRSLTKFKALMLNDMIYQIFDDSLTTENRQASFMIINN